MEKISLVSEDGDKIELYVLEETRISGINYILVTESDDENEDAEVYILKDTSKSTDADAIYEYVEDDSELDAVAKVFSELLEDVDFR
ncbi:DUF1292 domain-containing protein [Lachnospira pectinoschiza]|uniref:DUF1292 domain-containing protein n=1 Tax=Lachnospira pectinoschiza TaxID=28052 RepID=A0A1G9Z8G2_9FIRM|nr:DUF1292 domain-containing protein [Lachnospira pectinoschiza]SDN16683.1 Protein of unknown function [Lachnospira pectinoschiza]